MDANNFARYWGKILVSMTDVIQSLSGGNFEPGQCYTMMLHLFLGGGAPILLQQIAQSLTLIFYPQLVDPEVGLTAQEQVLLLYDIKLQCLQNISEHDPEGRYSWLIYYKKASFFLPFRVVLLWEEVNKNPIQKSGREICMKEHLHMVNRS